MNNDKTVELMSVLNNIENESCLDEFIKIAKENFSDLSFPSFLKTYVKKKI
ncbi:hypothetical protein QJS64_14700 [Paraclostridium bifermentans]|uniref:Uncharacterized protein n=1 Tax=Paraclostridium bifermentans TaxID=1490 RepID=A0ABY8R3M3_PARBF|nr:hypothetical protein QJS64_14700 [Paraclostridium bifermentans]